MPTKQEEGRLAILSLSGGLDSTTLLAQCVVDYGLDHVIPVQFVYGSKHNPYEVNAVNQIMRHYFGEDSERRLFRINLQQPFQGIQSSLMVSGGEIPEGHYNDKTMRSTVVPGRNLIFASICAAIAESMANQYSMPADVLLGVHSGDHHIYPDCRPEFITSLAETVYRSSEGRVTLYAPFTHDDKASIVLKGLLLNVPYELTRTCYKAQEVPCGKCGSCRERIEAFQLNDTVDPVAYAG